MDAFDAIVSVVDYPMYVVTAADPSSGERAGCLVGFATQCSISPARFVACLSKANHTYRVAGAAEVLAVHLVGSSQRDLAELFGSETGDEIDKFSRCPWREGPEGVPLLEGVPGWFAGRVVDRIDMGDHVGHVLDPFAGSVASRDGSLLTFHAARDIAPGHPA